jgi:hypothetical protein
MARLLRSSLVLGIASAIALAMPTSAPAEPLSDQLVAIVSGPLLNDLHGRGPVAPEPSAAVEATESPAPPPGPTPTAEPSQSPTPTPPTSSPAPVAYPPPPRFRLTRFAIGILPIGERPYDAYANPPLADDPPYHDAAGVPMQRIGGRLVYKPAGLSQLGILYVNAYRRTGDSRYLDRAVAIAAVFRRIGVRSLGGLYLPYRFDWAPHRNPAEVLRGPWYSAMAQGLALSLFTRLYQVTEEPGHLLTARQLYLSLRHIGRSSAPWVTYIDAGRYLWLEEYPLRYPDHVLNGALFAVIGLYDYYAQTRDLYALQTLRGALTTLKAHVIRYRNPGGPSDYCLRHGSAQIKYHRIHVWQLRLMTRITGDQYFAYVAGLFERDAR